jgi:polyhydroxybutyrate depolymerase
MLSRKIIVPLILLLSVLANTNLTYGADISLGQSDFLDLLTVDGVSREAWVHLPSGYDSTKKYPVVFVFHGGDGSLFTPFYESGMNGVADQNNFIVVYPQGTPVDPSKPSGPAYWNDGRPLADGSYMTADDVSFVKGLLGNLESKLLIDQSRVYASGISNGALMTYRLAKELPGTFAAIGTVAAVRGADEIQPAPAGAVPVISFNGLLDPIVPYWGGTPLVSNFISTFMPVQKAMQSWALHNGDLPDPVETLRIGNAVMTRWSGGAADVVLWTLLDGGHTWPGGNVWPQDAPYVGNINRDINASELMWDFFAQYELDLSTGQVMDPPTPTPLPPSIILLGSGLLGLWALGRRKSF